MCIEDNKCCAWISLESVGINASGCLRDPTWINNLIISSTQPIFNQNIYINLPDNKLTCLKNVAHGKFGYIDQGKLEVKNKKYDVYIKRPIIPGKNLIYEACIQKLVGEILEKICFPTGAPKLLSIIKLRDNSICFAMEQLIGSTALNTFIESVDSNQISNLIFKI